MSQRWRVVRQGGGGGTVCQHRFQRLAWWCARRHERKEPTGVFFDVRPAVKP